jgi:hypothetical protein
VETKNEIGEQLFMVKGLDGYLYRLTKKTKQTFIELSDLPTKLGQPFKPTKDGTEPKVQTPNQCARLQRSRALQRSQLRAIVIASGIQVLRGFLNANVAGA